jgi:hypothetical protein
VRTVEGGDDADMCLLACAAGSIHSPLRWPR